MTEGQWAEIGAALRKASDAKPPTDSQQSFIDVSDPLEQSSWLSCSSQHGSGKPYEFSWLTRKLFGWLLKDAD